MKNEGAAVHKEIVLVCLCAHEEKSVKLIHGFSGFVFIAPAELLRFPAL